MIDRPRIAVVGLGYVGLPLAMALAKHFDVTGFDIDSVRIKQLEEGYDRTREVEEEELKATNLKLTCEAQALEGHDLFIIAVPTPVTLENQPDLEILENASLLVGQFIKEGAVIVFESTVYPGVTENICGPLLEQASGLVMNKDFHLGYSPERVNPGDHVHTVEKMTKVIAGQTPEVEDLLVKVYGSLNKGNIFVAKNIATAEAAKVIENAQRDINIAFINKVTKIMWRLGLSVYDVLEAAETKWNFLPFRPGLVGGHCIGVDPYYLAHCAQELGIAPDVILSGRRTNESMSLFFADVVKEKIQKGQKMLVLGLTFKENIPDLRNTKVVDMIRALQDWGSVEVHDAFADPQEALKFYNLPLLETLEKGAPYGAIIGAVSHDLYIKLTPQDFERLLVPGGWVIDIKGIWRSLQWPSSIHYFSL